MSNRLHPKCCSRGNRSNDNNFVKRVVGVSTATTARVAVAVTTEAILMEAVINGCDTAVSAALPTMGSLPRPKRTEDLDVIMPDDDIVSSWPHKFHPPWSLSLFFSCWWLLEWWLGGYLVMHNRPKFMKRPQN